MATKRLEGKGALVTGAGGGIGRRVVELFSEHGARVVAADIDSERAQEVVAGSPTSHPLSIDLTDTAGIHAAVGRTVELIDRIDVVVNCAGMLQFGSAAELIEEDWSHSLEVNLTSVYRVAKAVWPALAAQRSGAIVNIGSVLGIAPMKDDIAYCTAKAGVLMLTKCLALDGAAAGIRVNCVSPGFIQTPMTESAFARAADPEAARAAAIARHPLGRLGEAHDVAQAVLYLASDEAHWVTGVNLVVDGGYMTVAPSSA